MYVTNYFRTSTAFTSVSQQYNSNKRYDNATNKPYWSRDHRKRQKRSYSFLSTTFDDTEVSMALDLVTVTFNMDTNLPFGMSIVWRERKDFCGIFVHQITKSMLYELEEKANWQVVCCRKINFLFFLVLINNENHKKLVFTNKFLSNI